MRFLEHPVVQRPMNVPSFSWPPSWFTSISISGISSMVQAKETAVGKLLEELISITREGKGNEWYKTMRSKWASSGAPQICVCNWCSQVKIFSRLDSFQFVSRPQPLIVNIWQVLTNSDNQGRTFASLPQTTLSSWAQPRALDQPPGSELTGSNRNSKSENNNLN